MCQLVFYVSSECRSKCKTLNILGSAGKVESNEMGNMEFRIPPAKMKSQKRKVVSDIHWPSVKVNEDVICDGKRGNGLKGLNEPKAQRPVFGSKVRNRAKRL